MIRPVWQLFIWVKLGTRDNCSDMSGAGPARQLLRQWVELGTRDNCLTIINMSGAGHSRQKNGQLWCFSFHKDKSHKFWNQKEKIILVGEKILVFLLMWCRCKVRAMPPANIDWLKESLIISTGGTHTHIHIIQYIISSESSVAQPEPETG